MPTIPPFLYCIDEPSSEPEPLLIKPFITTSSLVLLSHGIDLFLFTHYWKRYCTRQLRQESQGGSNEEAVFIHSISTHLSLGHMLGVQYSHLCEGREICEHPIACAKATNGKTTLRLATTAKLEMRFVVLLFRYQAAL
jgi:hypothetical protein